MKIHLLKGEDYETLDVPDDIILGATLLIYRGDYYQFEFRPAMSVTVPVFKYTKNPIDVTEYALKEEDTNGG